MIYSNGQLTNPLSGTDLATKSYPGAPPVASARVRFYVSSDTNCEVALNGLGGSDVIANITADSPVSVDLGVQQLGASSLHLYPNANVTGKVYGFISVERIDFPGF